MFTSSAASFLCLLSKLANLLWFLYECFRMLWNVLMLYLCNVSSYSHGVSSPGRHVRTRLYFTSESHVHSLLTVLRYGGLLDVSYFSVVLELQLLLYERVLLWPHVLNALQVQKDEQWHRAMEYVSMVSELNYMSQIVVMLYEDPTKDPCSEERCCQFLHLNKNVLLKVDVWKCLVKFSSMCHKMYFIC
jgi:hypothetical protein